MSVEEAAYQKVLRGGRKLNPPLACCNASFIQKLFDMFPKFDVTFPKVFLKRPQDFCSAVRVSLSSQTFVGKYSVSRSANQGIDFAFPANLCNSLQKYAFRCNWSAELSLFTRLFLYAIIAFGAKWLRIVQFFLFLPTNSLELSGVQSNKYSAIGQIVYFNRYFCPVFGRCGRGRRRAYPH